MHDTLRIAYPLSSRSTTIGRDASNAIVLRDPTASRFHAEVRREAGGFALRSIGALAATLNGQPVERPTVLREGDADGGPLLLSVPEYAVMAGGADVVRPCLERFRADGRIVDHLGVAHLAFPLWTPVAPEG